jgi:hypothetical protein
MFPKRSSTDLQCPKFEITEWVYVPAIKNLILRDTSLNAADIKIFGVDRAARVIELRDHDL